MSEADKNRIEAYAAVTKLIKIRKLVDEWERDSKLLTKDAEIPKADFEDGAAAVVALARSTHGILLGRAKSYMVCANELKQLLGDDDG